MYRYQQEVFALLVRWFRQVSREPFNLAFSLVQPIFWLVLFGHLFQNVTAGAGFGGRHYPTFTTAGIMMMTALGNCMAGGIPLLFDRESGVLDRLLVAPIARSSILVSRFIYVIIITTAQTLVILAAASLIGVKMASGVAGILGSVVIVILFSIGFTTLSLSLAYLLRGHGDFFAVTGLVNLPLLFLSSALVPLELMPGWMQQAAWFNPMTYATEGVRALIMRGWDSQILLKAGASLAPFDALCLLFGTWIFRRQH